jgi:2-oxoisovalerate dehydrogenase E2 component (dihydrolipoyl transacylase)
MGDFTFKLPDIGEGVVEAEITAWHVNIGDRVEEDAPLADAMTDKATIELTSPVDGVVKSLGCEEGDMFAVGGALVILETEGEADSDLPESDSSDSADIADETPKQNQDGSSEFIFKLPDIGEGVVEAEITAWHVCVGDEVDEDDPLADAMTDKATIELTSPVKGRVLSLGCEEGDSFAVGGGLVVLETEGEEGKADTSIAPTTPSSTPAKTEASKPPKPSQSFASPSGSSTSVKGKVLASPAVRKRAADAGLDLSRAKASGAEGQVTHADLDFLEKVVESVPGETRIKVIGLRRVIAQRMQEAKRHIPHFTYVEEIDVTELEAFRARINTKKSEDKPKLTVLPLIIRALALTLRDWPQFNARYMDGSDGFEGGYVSQFSDLNLGIATQTDIGLVVPVLLKAQSLNVWQMAEEIARLAEGARTNKLKPEEMSGASTTLTSLGPLGGIVTTPVINRPEVAIFGPNKIRKKLVLENGQVSERKVMNFSVSCDHRVIDGYDAAAMMQDMRALLEDPQMMFLL